MKLSCTGSGNAQTDPSFKIDAGTKFSISGIEFLLHVAEAEGEEDVKVELIKASEVVGGEDMICCVGFVGIWNMGGLAWISKKGDLRRWVV